MVKRDAGGVCGGQQLLQSGGNVRVGVAALFQISPQQIDFDAAVVLSLVPLAEIVVAEAIGAQLVGEQGDDAVLRFAFGAWLFRNGLPRVKPALSCR